MILPRCVTNKGQQGGEEQQSEADERHYTAVSEMKTAVVNKKFKLIIRQSNGCIKPALYKIRIN